MMGIFTRITERMDRQAHLMGAMMERLEVDVDAAGLEASGALLQRASRSCLMCKDSDECERWFESGAEGEPDFCPNARFFALHHR
jgi:hypothetical protein